MALLLACVLFLAFLANVLLGAMSGNAVLNDVGEMLVLFAASVAFVAAILQRETQTKKNKTE